MESKNAIPNIKLTIQTGGMIQFEKTGTLPNYLVFTSRELRRTWRLKLKSDTQNGVLKVNGQMAFHYFYDNMGCTMQSLKDGGVAHEWQIDEIMMEMLD